MLSHPYLYLYFDLYTSNGYGNSPCSLSSLNLKTIVKSPPFLNYLATSSSLTLAPIFQWHF